MQTARNTTGTIPCLPDRLKKTFAMKRILLLGAVLFVMFRISAQPKVIAHRGYWTTHESAQNSLASFAKAREAGCFGSEFDVWFTGDGDLIVNHNRVDKNTGLNMEKAAASEITSIVLANGETVSTLDAYLSMAARTPGIHLILEMKSLSDYRCEDMAAEGIVGLLCKYDLLDRTDIIAFSLNACFAFRKLLPEGRIFYLDGDLPPDKVKQFGFTGMDYSMKALRRNPQWVEEAHTLGLEVNVWTVNKDEDMDFFIELGVDYITTDYPEKLQAKIN